MVQQLCFFDSAAAPLPPKSDPHAGVNMEALEKLAILYTATEKGNNSGIRFMMSIEDALQWCASPISKGVLHGTEWAYFWTKVSCFITCYWLNEEPCIDLRDASDNGSWDRRIADMGLKKISVWEFSRVLGPLGVSIVNEPPVPDFAKGAS